MSTRNRLKVSLTCNLGGILVHMERTVTAGITATSMIQDVLQEDANLAQLLKDSEHFKICCRGVELNGKRLSKPDNFVLKDGDRIELLRAIHKTPNAQRLKRVKKH